MAAMAVTVKLLMSSMYAPLPSTVSQLECMEWYWLLRLTTKSVDIVENWGQNPRFLTNYV
jgi:hypothetical protein